MEQGQISPAPRAGPGCDRRRAGRPGRRCLIAQDGEESKSLVKVLITIAPTEAGAVRDRDWYALSSQYLEAAYGEDEPDYPLHLIKTPNPDFQR